MPSFAQPTNQATAQDVVASIEKLLAALRDSMSKLKGLHLPEADESPIRRELEAIEADVQTFIELEQQILRDPAKIIAAKGIVEELTLLEKKLDELKEKSEKARKIITGTLRAPSCRRYPNVNVHVKRAPVLSAIDSEASATTSEFGPLLHNPSVPTPAGQELADSEKLRLLTFHEAFQSAGALLYRSDIDESFRQICSGALIGCRSFVTAAHCFARAKDPDILPGHYKVFLHYGGLFDVKDFHWRSAHYKALVKNRATNADIAVVELAEAVEDVLPAPMSNVEIKKVPGRHAAILGFGLTEEADSTSGILRHGNVCTQQCLDSYPYKDQLVCWNYTKSAAPGKSSNSCEGDSGGPVFLLEENDDDLSKLHYAVAGVISGGRFKDCVSGDHSFNTSVFAHRQWIEKVWSELTGAHGKCPIRRELMKAIAASDSQNPWPIQGRITEEGQIRSFFFKTPDADKTQNTADLVRFAFSAVEKADEIDFDYYVVRGYWQDIPNISDGDKILCQRTGPGQFGSCEIKLASNPIKEGLSVIVQSRKGAGEFQIFATWWTDGIKNPPQPKLP